MKIQLATLLFIFSIYSFAQSDLRSIYNQGTEAYKSGDFKAFLSSMQQCDSLSPEHPTITYNLAAAHAKNGNESEAIALIQKALFMNSSIKPEEDGDFEGVDLSFVQGLKDQLNEEVKSGEIAFTNDELDLHPESVAFDPKTKTFFLNSVHKGKILQYRDGKFTEFSSGHWAIMGMKVRENKLWACEVATAELEGFDEADKGKTAVLEFDLQSGELLNRHELTGGHWFGDLIFMKDGTPMISDSMQPIVYTLKNGEISVFEDLTDRLYNLQGLALNKNESLLYIADYKVGLHVLDLKTRELVKMNHDTNMITKGIDGLYFYKSTLITIQNGVKPFRVSQFSLDKSGKRITTCKYLDKARPELGEPTLGVLVGDEFYYVANSPWGAYKDGVFTMDGLSENIVIKIALK